MLNRTLGTRPLKLRPLVVLSALLAATQAYGQQNLNVTAANSINNNIYSVTFSGTGGSTKTLNTDQKSLYSLQSLVFIPNINLSVTPQLFTLDLLAADNQNGKLLRYSGDFTGNPPTTTGTVVSQAAPIRYPTGLSVDPAGDLFVVNDAPGHSPQSQVWVLPADGSGGFLAAQRLDNTNTFGQLQATVETLVVGPALGDANGTAASSGNLLVLTSNPASVVQFSLNGPPFRQSTPTPLISQCTKNPPPVANCIPIGMVPSGMAIWLADNSLLISTQGGTILQFKFPGGLPVQSTFASGLSSTLYKIKTGHQGGLPRAFVAQSGPGNHGSILELGPQTAGAPISVLASVTQGVMAPVGIAVTNSAQALANTCQSAVGCNLLGDKTHNVLTHAFSGTSPAGTLIGNIVESVCIVPTELRAPGPNGACNDLPQNVNEVCPGFDNTPGGTMVIPGDLCASGTGYALIQTLTTHAQSVINNKLQSEFNGTYIENSADSTQLLPGVTNAFCGPPQSGSGAPGIATLLWAPLLGEGGIVEKNNMVDLTNGCGTSHNGTGYSSLWAVGLALDPTAQELHGGGNTTVALENYAQTKYKNLIQTVQNFVTNQNITNSSVAAELSNGSSGCIDISQDYYVNATTVDTIGSQQWVADMQNAANLLANGDSANNTTCDNIVANNLGSFKETSSPIVLNPSGQLLSRLGNLYYTINTEILGNPASNAWPALIGVSATTTTTTNATTNAATTTYSSTSATLSYNISSGANSCYLTSNDGVYTGTGTPVSGSGPIAVTPAQGWQIGTPVAYTITCSVPAGPATGVAYVTPVIGLSATQSTLTLSWNITNPASSCSLTSSDGAYTGTQPPNPYPVSDGTNSLVVTPTGTGPVNYTINCTVPGGSASATVQLSPPPPV